MSKTLVAYFSCTENTEKLAKTIAKIVNGDLYRITPEQEYTKEDLDWTNKSSRSSVEMADKNSRPKIKGKCENLDKYDKIYLGFPIWWYIAPTIINTFLESADFSGKFIIPFATSGGSSMGDSDTNLLKSLNGKGKLIHGKVLNSKTEEEVKKWVEGLKFE